jgi:penicillin-binding protein 1B
MPRTRKRQRRGKRSSWTRVLLRASLLTVLAASALVGGYLVYIDRKITSTFEGRRWSVPAQVYAQPLELFPWQRLSADQFEIELKRLGYRPSQAPGRPGTYRRERDEVRAVLRRFEFPDGVQESMAVRVQFVGARGNERISAVHDSVGRELQLVRVEPPMIGSFFPSHGEDRLIVEPGDVPPLLTRTLIAVEDRSFEHHRGFDLRAIARAFWVNLRAGGVRQGGSTLTQQLVKSYFLDNRRTFGRKFQELAMSVILELRFDKEDLLTAYINEINIGQDGNRAVHGFGLASQFYFNKPLEELSPAEIALLVAVIRGPSYYNPYRNAERAVARRDLVLQMMHEFGLIDADAWKQAQATPLQLAQPGRAGGRYYPAFMDLVRQQLARDYDAQLLASNGYRIFTTLNPRIQEAAERAVVSTLERIEARRELPAGELQAAIVVTNTQTGEVEAVVGGRRPGFQGFNYALNARRPIGSLVKPVIYLAAIEQRVVNLASIINDAPVALEMPNRVTWTPRNFDNEVHGPVPVVRALGDSLNLATVHLGLEVGVESVALRLGALLDQPAPQPFPSLLLGAVEMTPLDMARLYGVFASGGFAAPTKAIVAVEDRGGARLDRFPLKLRQVAAPDDVAQVNFALDMAMRHGTGRGSPHGGHGVAGKTGTSSDYRDSWFAGFDAARLAVVWVGYGDNRPSQLTGSSGAMQVWNSLVSDLSVTPLTIRPPRDYQLVTIDYHGGLRADERCGQPVSVPLPYGTQIRTKPGCSALGTLGERVRSWFGN